MTRGAANRQYEAQIRTLGVAKGRFETTELLIAHLRVTCADVPNVRLTVSTSYG